MLYTSRFREGSTQTENDYKNKEQDLDNDSSVMGEVQFRAPSSCNNMPLKCKCPVLRSKSLDSFFKTPHRGSCSKPFVCSTENCANAMQYTSIESIPTVSIIDSGMSKTGTDTCNCSQTSRPLEKMDKVPHFCHPPIMGSQQYALSPCCKHCSYDNLKSASSVNPSIIQNAVNIPHMWQNIRCHTVPNHFLQAMLPTPTPSMQPSNQHFCSNFPNVNCLNSNAMSLTATGPVRVVCSGASCQMSMPYSVTGTSFTYPCIQSPTNLDFPKVVCIGDTKTMDLPIQNPMTIPLLYHLLATSATLDGSAVPTEAVSLDFPRVIRVNGGCSANVEVKFVAKQEGRATAQLQIEPFFFEIDHQLGTSLSPPAVVSISYEAENPRISLEYRGKDRMNLDFVVAGSTLSESITVINRGRAEVPLRLVVSGVTQDRHTWHFGLQDLNGIKSGIPQAELYCVSPKIIICRIPGKETSDAVKVDLPMQFYTSDCQSSNGGNAETIINTITAILESPSVIQSVASIQISVTVGKVQLSLKHPQKIHLSGYGGISSLKITDVPQKEGLGYCFDIMPSFRSETSLSKIMVQNIGSRAAFVKLLCYSDQKFGHNKSSVRIDVQPSEFVLLENECKIVIVACSCLDLSSYQNYAVQNCGTIVIYYGDEVMRQRMRRASGKSSFTLPPSHPLQGVNFDVSYLWEDKVVYDPAYADLSKDAAAMFYISIQCLLVHLSVTSKNHDYSIASHEALSILHDVSSVSMSSRSMLSRVLEVDPSSPPVTEVVTFTGLSKTVSLGSKNKPMILWSAVPEAFTFDCKNKKGCLLLTNQSNQNLKGKIGLRIQIVPLCISKLKEKKHGFVKIFCGGIKQYVPVKVYKSTLKPKIKKCL